MVQEQKYVFPPGTPKIIQWMMKYSGGLIQTRAQVIHVLLVLVALVIIASLFLLFGAQQDSARNIKYNPDTKYGGQELPDSFR